MKFSLFAYVLIVFCCAIAFRGPSSAQESQPDDPLAGDVQSSTVCEPIKLNVKYLPNAIRIHDRVTSGGQPDGEQGFRELSELGFKTVISVDGAKPDVATAKQFGLRYVHLPHGYNGIVPERVNELAKAVRNLDGPIYIHCHHGKHRSPAAAAVACVSAGLIERSSSPAILKLAGTSENYQGLFDSVKLANRLSDAYLGMLQPDFHETAKLPPMAEAMVELEHTIDQLKRIADAGWLRGAAHPDLDLAHEALLLKEHFAEMLRMESATNQTEDFRTMLRESASDAQLLEDELRQNSDQLRRNLTPSISKEPLARITAKCASCHRQYRDVPIRNGLRE